MNAVLISVQRQAKSTSARPSTFPFHLALDGWRSLTPFSWLFELMRKRRGGGKKKPRGSGGRLFNWWLSATN